MDDLSAVAPAADTPASVPADTPAPAEPAKAVEESPGDKAAAAEQALDDDLRKAYRNANRERDDSGKFASKDGKPAVEAPAVEAHPAATDQPAEKPVEPAAPAVPAPNSWSREAKAEWDKLPPTLQQTIAQREAESHKTISELGRFAKQLEPVHKAISDHADRINSSGVDAGTYIANVLKADQALSRDPVGFIRYVAEHYKIDVNSVFDPFAFPVQDAQSQQVTAQLNAAFQEIERLNRQLSDTRQKVEGREAQEQQARQSQYEKDVNEFAADKPDFEGLIAEIQSIIPLIRQASPNLAPKDVLQQAYDRARWANPTTRSALLAAQQAEADKKRLEAAKKEAVSAKRIAAINVNGSVPQREASSLDDDLRSVWRRAHAS